MTAAALEAQIEFRNAGKSFVTEDDAIVRALSNVTFSLQPGEFVSIVGPSGCGKSTTLNMLAGLTDVTEGDVYIGGERPGSSSLDIGYVFQQDSVLPWKTVLDNIEIGLVLRGMSASERRKRSEDLLQFMGLDGFGDAFPAALSGGMRKRVALATTLAYNPVVLLMDEPFGALDAQTRIILQEELLRIWNEKRQTVLFVTHDIGEAIAMSDRVIVMTARPARIKSVYEVDLPRPRDVATVRFAPGFDEIYTSIWEDLRPEISAQSRVGGEQS
jgi:NitT/TauT family transport system ATP-binding protein